MRTFYPSSRLLRLVGATFAMLLVHLSVNAQVDPPGRVARISYASGSLSLAVAGSEQWTDVAMNRPISVGDSLWVPELGRAELHVGSSAIRLNERTSLSFLTLSDDSIQLKLTRGTMVVRLRSLSGKEAFEINTPNLAFSLQEAGEYRVTVNDDNTSNVMVRRGAAIAYGDRDSISIREAEQVLFSGTNLSHNAINRMPPYDTFDQWVNDRDRAEDTSVSARYVSREVIGYQQLDGNGTWETNAEYGAIWLPRTTEIGWAPYRNGNWLWVAPWGWTWVDRAPWGFAPYHYGRWAHIGLRWAWVPGRSLYYERPVYAPALVAFVGGGSGVSISLNIGVGRGFGPGVAWFPLAPGEAYRPSYYASPRYLDGVNRRSGTNITINNTTINNTTINNTTIYANQHVYNAVTAVPTSTFVKGQFVGGVARPLTRDQMLTSQVGAGAPAITPSSDSFLGTSKRIGNPDNSVIQYRNRPVVATFKPAELPVVQDSSGKSNLGIRRGDIDREPRSGGNVNLTNLRSRTVAESANSPVAPTPAITSSPVLLHNGGRSDIRDRNNRISDRANDEISGVDRRSNNANTARRPAEPGSGTPVVGALPPTVNTAPSEQIRRSSIRSDERDTDSENRRLDNRDRNEKFNNQGNGIDRRNNTENVLRRPQENSMTAPIVRTVPDPVANTAPMDQNRRTTIRNDERDAESGNRQFSTPRPAQNNSNANRVEQRRDDATLGGFNNARENTQPAPVQRPVERVFQAPREVSRPNQEPTMQQPSRVERQPVSEPRRETPAALVKPEREKERKDKSDSREKMER